MNFVWWHSIGVRQHPVHPWFLRHWYKGSVWEDIDTVFITDFVKKAKA